MTRKVRLHPLGSKNGCFAPLPPQKQAKCTPPNSCIKIRRYLQSRASTRISRAEVLLFLQYPPRVQGGYEHPHHIGTQVLIRYLRSVSFCQKQFELKFFNFFKIRFISLLEKNFIVSKNSLMVCFNNVRKMFKKY